MRATFEIIILFNVRKTYESPYYEGESTTHPLPLLLIII